MLQRPSPLQTLRTFAAAVRTLSFTLAAKELNLSQSVVNQQIKLLEDNLQVKLFIHLLKWQRHQVILNGQLENFNISV